MEMLKIERILRSDTVESTVIHQADHETHWQLTLKQLFVIHVAIMPGMVTILHTTRIMGILL